MDIEITIFLKNQMENLELKSITGMKTLMRGTQEQS